MRPDPPEQLTELTQRLGLATADQVRRVGGRVRRLARQLPLFESVWVDALAQARILTQLQAAEINAGRGNSLRVGPYVLCRRLPSPGYFDGYQARKIESLQEVRLAVFRVPTDPSADPGRQLKELVSACRAIESEGLAPIDNVGIRDYLGWAACRACGDRTVADWIAHNGRLPPQVVLEIARQMLVSLVKLENAGVCHGDLSTTGLAWTDGGGLVLPHPGLRGILRPAEGYAGTDLAPENFDYMAPERITGGKPPTVTSDIYACGCVWWHLLTGRPPVPGGTGLAKLRGHLAMDVPEVRRIAAETPRRLAAAIAASVRRDPNLRPQSMAELSAILSAPTRAGQTALARCMTRGNVRVTRLGQSMGKIRRSKRVPLWVAGIGGCLVAVVAVIWQVLPAGVFRPTADSQVDNLSRIDFPQPGQRREVTSNSVPEALPPVGGEPARNDGNRLTAVKPARSREIENDLLLNADGPVLIDSTDLEAGQRVCGLPGRRPLVMVPPSGLIVRPENVRFENIDFVWEPAPAAGGSSRRSALIHLEASRAEFSGCSFQAADATGSLPVAIRWTHPRTGDPLALPSGEVRFDNCVFRQVEAGIAAETMGAISLELTNVLHLGRGPLVRLDHAPRADEPVGIGLTNVTLRDTGPLVQCRSGQMDGRGGNISIRSAGCAFATLPNVALLSFAGPASPKPLLGSVYWTGQGSLVSPETVIAAWQREDGGREVFDDAAVSIAGLVRGRVDFAGLAAAGPAASGIMEWQAPLQSPDPPGVDVKHLWWPAR